MQFNGEYTGAAGSAITAALLGEYWPVAHDRLMKALQANGIDAATAEDAVAEAATRALSRGIAAENVDDFCRWAFIVARNIARDEGRQARRLVLVDAVPDRADQYDLAGHVEFRQRWNETTDAMTSLSPFDQAVLLTSLTDDETSTTRREAVKQAVRRHRARARLRHALGEVGAALGLERLRRPWWRFSSPEWMAAFDRAGPALLLPLAATMGWLLPAEPMARPDTFALAPPTTTSSLPATPITNAPAVRPDGVTRTTVRPAEASAAPVALAAPEAADDGVTRGTAFRFTPSPSYDDDHTVFATAFEPSDSCGATFGSCPLLYKSTDGGATWKLLQARDRGVGEIMLPPSYPADPRIFSAGSELTVSTDGGETFQVLAPAAGPASMSPLFSSGDPRILFGSSRALRVPVTTQYRDGQTGLSPVHLPLPPDFLAMEFWFGPDFANDPRTFVSGVEIPKVNLPSDGPVVDLYRPLVYACEAARCELVLDLGFGGALAPSLAWSSRDPRVLMVSNTFSLHRSTDGGRTFAPVSLPGPADSALIQRVMSAPDGRLFVGIHRGSAHQLLVSHDDGVTWGLVHEGSVGSWGLIALPDGVLLDSRASGSGIACSLDGGATWLEPCSRPPARSH